MLALSVIDLHRCRPAWPLALRQAFVVVRQLSIAESLQVLLEMAKLVFLLIWLIGMRLIFFPSFLYLINDLVLPLSHEWILFIHMLLCLSAMKLGLRMHLRIRFRQFVAVHLLLQHTPESRLPLLGQSFLANFSLWVDLETGRLTACFSLRVHELLEVLYELLALLVGTCIFALRI